MIGGAGADTPRLEMPHEATEGRSIGKQQGEVKEAGASALRHRPRSLALAELDQRGRAGQGTAEHCARRLALDAAQPEYLLIEGERAPEIRDLQSHRPEPGSLGQSETARWQAVASRSRRFDLARAAEDVAGPIHHDEIPS